MSDSTSSSPSDFRMMVEYRGPAAVVTLIGSMTMDVCDEFQEQLLGLVAEQSPQLVLDLSELEFISSLGISAIIAAHVRCRHFDGVVKLVAPGPTIQELLDVTKLNRLFSSYPTVEAALATE